MSDIERFLEGKHAIVTGGSRGIGAAVASELVARGAKVTIMGRDRETLERQAQEMRGEEGVTVAVEQCDVTDASSVTAAFSQAIANLGPAYILVNNAGTAKSRVFTQLTREIWDETIATNLTVHIRSSSGNDPGKGRANHQRRFDGRTARVSNDVSLLRIEAWNRRVDSLSRSRDSEAGNHRECRLPELHRHLSHEPRGGQHRKESQQDCR